ncbi:hypothetical protein BD560DRAFT_410522 [Blakeslea trispora]|nr:hypothetical protein BD560DRAFT_410522 [Blakeslea trispora]
MSTRLNISWKGKKFFVEFNSLKELNNTTVGELKKSCQRVVGLDANLFDLFAFGARMNSLELPLSAFDLQPSCTLLLVKRQDQPQEKAEKDEHSLLSQLSIIQTKLNQEVMPQIEQYEQQAKSMDKPTEAKRKQHLYTAAYLNEQLMHILFDLDSILCDPEAVEARLIRKQTVKQAQTLLDKTDEIKSLVSHVSFEE